MGSGVSWALGVVVLAALVAMARHRVAGTEAVAQERAQRAVGEAPGEPLGKVEEGVPIGPVGVAAVMLAEGDSALAAAFVDRRIGAIEAGGEIAAERIH